MARRLVTRFWGRTRATVADMVALAAAMVEQRRTARMKAHLDWSEAGQRARRGRR